MNSPGNTIFETSLLKCWFAEDGILHSVSNSIDRKKEHYEELFALYTRLSENGTKKFCLLSDISETPPLSKEMHEYITTETQKHVHAMALLSTSEMGKITGTIFTVLSGSPFPIAVFEDKGEALLWLRTHL